MKPQHALEDRAAQQRSAPPEEEEAVVVLSSDEDEEDDEQEEEEDEQEVRLLSARLLYQVAICMHITIFNQILLDRYIEGMN